MCVGRQLLLVSVVRIIICQYCFILCQAMGILILELIKVVYYKTLQYIHMKMYLGDSKFAVKAGSQ